MLSIIFFSMLYNFLKHINTICIKYKVAGGGKLDFSHEVWFSWLVWQRELTLLIRLYDIFLYIKWGKSISTVLTNIFKSHYKNSNLLRNIILANVLWLNIIFIFSTLFENTGLNKVPKGKNRSHMVNLDKTFFTHFPESKEVNSSNNCVTHVCKW